MSKIDDDKHWKYNKNFIEWVVDVTKESVEKGGMADEMIESLKRRSLDSLINLKEGAQKYAHRAEHLLTAIKTVRGL